MDRKVQSGAEPGLKARHSIWDTDILTSVSLYAKCFLWHCPFEMRVGPLSADDKEVIGFHEGEGWKYKVRS